SQPQKALRFMPAPNPCEWPERSSDYLDDLFPGHGNGVLLEEILGPHFSGFPEDQYVPVVDLQPLHDSAVGSLGFDFLVVLIAESQCIQIPLCIVCLDDQESVLAQQ